MARPIRDLKIVPLDGEQKILIPFSKYEELLVIKGKYDELKNNNLVAILIDKYNDGKITINQIREILGFKPIKAKSK